MNIRRAFPGVCLAASVFSSTVVTAHAYKPETAPNRCMTLPET